jgi:hypothetical protein
VQVHIILGDIYRFHGDKYTQKQMGKFIGSELVSTAVPISCSTMLSLYTLIFEKYELCSSYTPILGIHEQQRAPHKRIGTPPFTETPWRKIPIWS